MYRLLLLSTLLVPFAHAQEAVLEASLADSIVVTAARQAEDVRLTGRRVVVITSEELARLPITSFDELLRTVGGVEVHSRGGFGVQSDLTMRGSSFNGVLVLLDGARLNDPMTGHFITDLPVPLSEIARIEVLRGAASALYGPDALGGVIQLFTFTGLRRSGVQERETEGMAEVTAGSYGMAGIEAQLRTTGARSAVSAASTLRRSDGMPVRDGAGSVLKGSSGDVRTDFSRQAHSASLAYFLGAGDVFVRAGIDNREFGAFHFYTQFSSDTAREATSTYWSQIRLAGRSADRPWQVQLSARQHGDRYVYNPATPANRHTSRLVHAQLETSRSPMAHFTVTGGASASYRSIDSNNLGVHDDLSAGAFVWTRLQPSSRIALSAGGRTDYDPGYGFEVTPQVSAAYNRATLTVRGAAGRAVRAPDYVERYINTTLARPRGRDLGNPNLKPERAWSYEIGADLYPRSGVSLHATAFQRDTHDLIDYAMLTPADTVWMARNILSVQTRGMELDAGWTTSLAGRRARIAASYTLLDADLSAAQPGAEYKYAMTNARHLLQGSAVAEFSPVQTGLQVLWKERLDGSSHAVVNARAGYRRFIGQQQLAFTIEVRNLFDVQYADVFDAPMPGRWWIAGLRLSR